MVMMNLVLAVVPATPLRLPEATAIYMKNICDALDAVDADKHYVDDAMGLFQVTGACDISDIMVAQQRAVLEQSDGRWQMVWHLWFAEEPLLWSEWCRILDEKRRRPAADHALPEWTPQMPDADAWAIPQSGTTLTLSFATAPSLFGEQTVEAVCSLAATFLAPFANAVSSSLLGVLQIGEADELLPPVLRLAEREPALSAGIARGRMATLIETGLALEDSFLSWQEACSFCHWLMLFRTLFDDDELFCRRLYDVLNDEMQSLVLSRVALAMNQSSLPPALSASIYEAVLTEKSRQLMYLGLVWALQ